MSKVLETVLVGRNLLSPVLASAGQDVVKFNATVAGAHEKAAAAGAASARTQQAAATQMATASGKASTAATVGAGTQSAAADKIAASNVKASTSAAASSQAQMRAHARAAESATVSARVQEAATRSLAASNGLLGTSLTPLTAGLTAGALALAYAGYKGMEFDSAMSQVQAASQATAGDMDRMRDAAMKAGADTQYSAVEAAQGITEMSKAGVSAKDILGGGLTGALNLAAAGQISVAEAAETGATALSVFNLNGNQMSHVADLLAAGAGKAQGSVGDMSQALNQSALVAAQMGLSIEDTTGALAMFAHNGLIGSDAGTSFKSMLQRLNPQSEEAARLMDELGLRAYDSQGRFVGLAGYADQLKGSLSGMSEEQRNATLNTLFGSDAIRAASILYKEGSAGVRQWAKDTDDAGYAQKQAAQLTDNLRGDLERLGGAADAAFTSIGDGAQGPLREAVQGLTAVVNAGGDVLGFFNGLPGPVQAGLLAMAGWAVAGDKVMGILRPMGGVMGPVREAWSAFSTDLAYARDNGYGASLAVKELGVRAGGQTLTALKALGHAIGPELAVAGGVFILTSFVDGLRSMTQASDEAKAAADGLAKSLTLTDRAADRKAIRTAIEDTDGLVEVLDKAGVSSETAVNGLLGQEAAQRRVLTALREYKSEVYSPNGAGGGKESQDAREAVLAYEELATGYGTAASNARYFAEESGGAAEAAAATGDAAAASVPQINGATEAVQDWLDELQQIGEGFIEPLGIYQDLLSQKQDAERASAEATAASTASSKDSWKDYVSDVSVSLDEYATKLEEQLTAQDNWRANIATITQRGGMEVGQILAGMGAEGAQIAAQMATAMPAEFERLKNDLIREAQGATAGLDGEMKVMQAVGIDGAGKTAWGIASQLQIGVDQVLAIAAKYGVNLAVGINPLLDALGRDRAPVGSAAAKSGGYYDGGYTGPGGKYEYAGPAHKGEVVWSQDDVAAHGGPQRVDAMRRARGYADGGYVTAADVPRPPSTAPYRAPISSAGDATMQKGFDEVRAWLTANVGVAGSGSLGGEWQSIFNFVKARIPQARVNSAYRPGDPGYHGRGKAVDFGFGSGSGGAGSAGLASINRLLHDSVGRNLAELIYDGIGDDRPDLKNGRPLTYSAATRAQHHNHVHAAVYDQGGPLYPGWTMAYNGTGRTETVVNAPPASMPGYGMGGGGGAAAPARPVVVSLAGATVTGRFEFGSDGLIRLVDGRIDGAFQEAHDHQLYNR